MNTLSFSIADGNKPYWTWLPLIFSSFYFLPTIMNVNNVNLLTLLYIFMLYISFILLYGKAVYCRGNEISPWLLAMVLIIASGTYLTPGTQTLFGYIAFLAGFNLTQGKSLTYLLFITTAILISGYLLADSNLYFYVPALIMSTGLYSFGVMTRKDAIHEMKEKHSEKHIEQLATIAERERIARDMHDLIGHSLTSIALKAELAEKHLNINNVSQAKQEINQVSTLSREILSQVRQAVSGLKTRDINGQLAQLKAKLIKHYFSVQVTNRLVNCSAIIESSLILMLTEAVTNILKHSKGNRVTIELEKSHHNINLFIADNGNVSEIKFGNGLSGISERCQQLNGVVKITHEHGMSIRITLPEKPND
jgi:two-component system sensor histidine kinase DesK